MNASKFTTTKALPFNLKQETGTNNGVLGESFRFLYYGSEAAGSVPFMWESHPGTPKHALAESSLPPLTPPPSYHHHRTNSSMHLIKKQHSSKRSGFIGKIFLSSSWKRNDERAATSSFSCSSVSSSSSHLHSWQSTPMSKTEVRRMMKFGLEEDQEQARGGSHGWTTCLGGGFKRSYKINKMKKAIQWFVCHGKTN